MILLPGLVGISLARNPDGLVSDVRNARASRPREDRHALAGARAARAGRAVRATAAFPSWWDGAARSRLSDLRALDRELGFATEECNGAA